MERGKGGKKRGIKFNLGLFKHPEEKGEALQHGRTLTGGKGCGGLPLGMAGRGGPSSLGTGVTGCWHCAFALVLCGVCIPDWSVLLCCKLGDCWQLGVSCPNCAVVSAPSVASMSLSLP